jgi:hypothetical protein
MVVYKLSLFGWATHILTRGLSLWLVVALASGQAWGHQVPTWLTAILLAMVAWDWYLYLTMVYEIRVVPGPSICLRGALTRASLSPKEITGIRTTGPFHGFWLIGYRGGTFRVMKNNPWQAVPDRDVAPFLSAVRDLNPDLRVNDPEPSPWL